MTPFLMIAEEEEDSSSSPSSSSSSSAAAAAAAVATTTSAAAIDSSMMTHEQHNHHHNNHHHGSAGSCNHNKYHPSPSFGWPPIEAESNEGEEDNEVDARSPVAMLAASISLSVCHEDNDVDDENRDISRVQSPLASQDQEAAAAAAAAAEASAPPTLPRLMLAASPQEQKEEQPGDEQGLKPVSQPQQAPRPQPQPFFVLDWLEDLVPPDQDAEQLAELLQTPLSPPPQKLTLTHSTEASSAASPLVRFLSHLHWGGRLQAPTDTNMASSHRHRGYHSAPSLFRAHKKNYQEDEDDNEEEDNDDGDNDSSCRSPSSVVMAGMHHHQLHHHTNIKEPATPKSSNKRRKAKSSRRIKSHNDLTVNDEDKDDNDDERGFLPIPKRLEAQLNLAHCQSEATTASDADADATTTSHSQQQERSQHSHHRRHHQRQWQQQRRQQRQKNPCIVRRSLEMAQAWNTKGLHKAHQAGMNSSNDCNNNTDSSSNQQEQWMAALEAWDNALEIYGSLLGRGHVQFAMVQNNRGIALGRLERFEEALEALDVALEIRQCRLADNCGSRNNRDTNKNSNVNTNNTSTPQQVVSTLHNIANVHQAKGDLTIALQVLGHARHLSCCHDNQTQSSTSSSSSSIQSARLCVAMGHVYWEAMQWNDAYDAYQDALEVYEELARSSQQCDDDNNNNNEDDPLDYEIVVAELLSLRVDIQELEGILVHQESQRHQHQQQQAMMTSLSPSMVDPRTILW